MIVHYQEATRVWIYDDGSSHTGHLIELLPETERKPLELSEMLAGQAPISLEVKALAAAPDLLHKIKIDLDRFIVGEDENKLHLFLICLSSATAKPSGAIITGEASSGKSTLLHAVTQYFANVDYFTRVTPASIDRLPGDLAGRILVVEELRGAEAAQPSIRVAISEGRLRLLTTDLDDKGRRTTRVIERKGTPVFITTTTATAIDHETQARLDLISMDESEAQTKLVLGYEADQYSNSKPKAEPDAAIGNLLRSLQPFDVLVPFADIMAMQFPTDTLSARRDFRKLLQIMSTATFLHQHQRLLVKKRDDPIRGWLVATPMDLRYALVIAGASLRQSLMGLPSRVLALLQYFQEGIYCTSRMMAGKAGISQRTARRWQQNLVRAGYLSVDETQKEHQFYLVEKARQALSLELPESVREWNPEKLHSWLTEEGYRILREAPDHPYIDPLTGLSEPPSSPQRPLTACQSEPENAALDGQAEYYAARPHETVNLSSDSYADSGQEDGGRETPESEGDDSDRERALAKLRSMKGPMSWDYALSQAVKATGDRIKAEGYLKRFQADGRFVQDPDGYWTLTR
jgi:hypothetical protein